MDTVITVSIMALMLFARSGSARATTVFVSNQMKSRGNVPVFVTCHGTPELSKSVPLGHKTLIEIPSTAGDIVKAEASRDLPHTTCVGTFYSKKYSDFGATWYVLYDSDKEYCQDSCFVVVKDDGFFRWNSKKGIWEMIPPEFWIY